MQERVSGHPLAQAIEVLVDLRGDRIKVTLKVYEGETDIMYHELALSRPFSHVYEVRVGACAHNVANLGSSFTIREMRLTFYE